MRVKNLLPVNGNRGISMKKYKLSLITLLLALVCAVSLCFGVAGVLARTVTIDGSNFFYANSGADVRAYHEAETSKDYTTFYFTDNDDNVVYRYNLAYHWYSAPDADENGDVDYTAPVEGWFNMELGFRGLGFDRYTIKFQSQQYAETKDGVTDNYITFAVADNGLKVIITDDEEQTKTPAAEIAGASLGIGDGTAAGKIKIVFTEYNEGVYTVEVSDGTNTVTGYFNNVGGSFARRVNSTTEGVMPLTFSADFGDAVENNSCEMVLFSLNGQSFELMGAVASDDGDYYTGGTVNDNCPPVLCVNGDVSYLEYGVEPDFEYTVIDVLASAPRSTINYYVLTGELYSKGTSFDYEDVSVPEDGDPLFNRTSSDDNLVIDGSDLFLPSDIVAANKSGENGYTVGCLAKVYLELTDVTSSSGNNSSTKVFLDWYIEDTVTVNEHEFIKVALDEQGASYETDDIEARTAEYQSRIDEATTDGDGNVTLSAGSSSSFYLPSFEGFIKDNLDGYEQLVYSVYYTANGVTGSATSLAYNSLSISLNSAGTYKFTVYATDRAGNPMYYLDENGKAVEFETSEIYDDGVKDKLPWFTFDVIYTGATVEDPGEQATGYVGTTYSSISFDINGISDYYTTAYSLYRFDREAYNAENGTTITYSEFVSKAAELFEGDETRKYFTTIKPLASLNENDPDYDEYADYAWNASSVSFVPQDANSFYLVRLTVTDTYYHLDDVNSYMAIHVSEKADSYAGDSRWLQNNVVSVVLFCIAGVAAIGVIVLLVVKPKQTGDLDEQLAAESKKNKKNK